VTNYSILVRPHVCLLLVYDVPTPHDIHTCVLKTGALSGGTLVFRISRSQRSTLLFLVRFSSLFWPDDPVKQGASRLARLAEALALFNRQIDCEGKVISNAAA
jgi:hypothetical protein